MKIDITQFNFNRDDIANQVVAGLIILIATSIALHSSNLFKKPINKTKLFLLKNLPVFFTKIIDLISLVVSFFVTPLFYLFFLFVTAVMVFILLGYPYGLIYSVIIVLIAWSSFSQLTRKQTKAEPEFFDTFEGLKRWTTINGNPQISYSIGNPKSALYLPIVANNPNNSQVELKNLNFNNGVIECDVYLEPNSLVNILFRADTKNKKYYMARLDSRHGNQDAFLRNDGSGWFIIASSSHTTNANEWQKIKAVVTGNNFQLFNQDGLILSTTDDTYKSGSVGLFNEVANAYVDNFAIKT